MISRVAAASRQARSTPPIAPVARTGERLDLAECFRYCEAIVRAHHENFPVASRFLPARLRPHVCALYAFTRTADDFADEPAYAGRRLAELDRWEDLLHRTYHGEADHPIFVALADTIQRFDLPIRPLEDMLHAFRMDVRVRRYATHGDLQAYVALAAQPIGRLLLYVFGERGPQAHRFADDLSSALALTSFWQDIGRDLPRDRVYVPQEDLRHFGVTEDDLFARRQTPALTALIRYQCARTRALYERARPLVDLVPDELGVELALIFYGGTRALDMVEALADRVFVRRARLGVTDKAWVLAKALARRGGGLLGR